MASAVLSASKQSVYESVTAQIVVAIEAGAGTCVMPWHGSIVPMTVPKNATTGSPYHGVNVVALWAQAANRRFMSGYWASYQQWQKLGAQVRRREQGSLIIFYKRIESVLESESGDAVAVPRSVIRWSYVFNAAQVDGWDHPASQQQSAVVTNEQIEAFIRATKADIRHGSSVARYNRLKDYIELPAPEHFIGTPTSSPTEAYYAVLLHELTHWAGAPHRLDRVKGKEFGDPEYAFEELVAELGAAFLCSAFGIVNEPRLDHAGYIAHWLDILGRDNRAIFKAASLAQHAVEYLLKLDSAEQLSA